MAETECARGPLVEAISTFLAYKHVPGLEALGEALLVFAEGSRSRSGGMQRLLPGVARYLEPPNVWILPMGLTGTERLFPIGEAALHPVPIVLTIGRPIQATVLRAQSRGDRQQMMDGIGAAIATLLPPAYRGVYS